MKLSVLIPYKADGGHRDRIFEWILSRYSLLMPDAEICIGTNDNAIFNRSQARNNAFRQATGEMLLVADADTVPEPSSIFTGWMNIVSQNSPWVVPYSTYYNLGQEVTERILNSDPDDEVHFDDNDCEHIIQSTAGMLLLPRSAWEAVGGYDERFIGWGYEDNAFQLALDVLVGFHDIVSKGKGIHLWHPVPVDGAFNSPWIEENRRLFRKYERASRKPQSMKELVDS